MRTLRSRAALVAALLAVLLGPSAAGPAPAASPRTSASLSTTRAPDAPPAGAAAVDTPPAAVPPPLIVGASEEALALLARIERAMRDDPELDRISQELPEAERAVVRLRAAVAMGRRSVDVDRELMGLERDVLRTERRVEALDDGLEARARQVQAFADELRRLHASWDATAASPALATAPARVRERAAEMVKRITEVEGLESGYVSRLVDLQERVAAVRVDLVAARDAVNDAERSYERQLFEAESTPLWSLLGRSRSASEETRLAGAELALQASSIGGYLASSDANPFAHLAFSVVLAAALWALKRALTADPSPFDAGTARLLRHPFLAALVSALVCSPWFEPGAPPRLIDAALLVATVPFTAVAIAAVPRRLAVPVAALAFLLALDRLVVLGARHTAGARLVVLAICVAGAVLAHRGVRRGGWASALGQARLASAARAGLWGALVLLVVAALSNVFGNVTLALRLLRGTLFSAVGAIFIAGVWRVVAGALHVVLRTPAARRFRLVRAHAPLLERRSVAVTGWVALVAWGVGVAQMFRILTPVLDAAGAVLRRRLEVGSLSVSLGDVAAFVVVLAIAVQLARLVGFVLEEGLLPSLPLARGLPDAISKTARYLLVGLGAVAALYASGIELSRFSLLAGTLGVGIGFGLQNIVNNFISGLILLYERPVQVGDAIEVGALLGEVRRIGIRSSTVRTYQGADVIVPNGVLIQSQVVNWTLTDRSRRAEIAVGVAYGSDPEQVRRVLLAAVEGRDDVLPRPEPVALFTGFGDSALAFELRFWARYDRWGVVASDVREVILRELGRAGISIPFPQQDVHVRSVDGAPPALATRNVAAGPLAVAGEDATPERRADGPAGRREGG